MQPRPFLIAVPDAALDDLRLRLAATRWPDGVTGAAAWELGVDLDYLRDLIAYWRDGFDWRAREAALNRFHHFLAETGGLEIHFLHARGRGPRPLPLVLTHGWPGSFAEMLEMVPLLADPGAHGGDAADAFDVVVPSLPGYGFSERPAHSGWNLFRIADLWAELMEGLGYRRFVAQGGDFGAGVATALALRHPERLFGIHLNYIPGSYRPHLPDGEALTPEEEAFLAEAEAWYRDEGGYAHVQATKPQTLGVALNDSPAGLAAWMVEKFLGWSDGGGEVERRLSRDELLTHVALYWLTETMPSAIRLYREGRKRPLHFAPGEAVGVPCGIAHFPVEAPFPPRAWIERGYQVEHWTQMPAGGHFAAMEEPALLAEDIRRFCRRFR